VAAGVLQLSAERRFDSGNLEQELNLENNYLDKKGKPLSGVRHLIVDCPV
jgi:hypothetical protein